MDRQDRQNAIATALENGQHLAARMMVEADNRLSAIDDVSAVGTAETHRIQSVINHAMPTQSEHNRAILTSPHAGNDDLPFRLRDVARSIRNNGGGYEAGILDGLARLIDDGPALPTTREALDLRNRISAVLDKQNNAEVRRWFLLALSPGSPVVTNTGDRIA